MSWFAELVDALADPRQAIKSYKEERKKQQLVAMGIKEEDIGDVLQPIARNQNSSRRVPPGSANDAVISHFQLSF